MSKESVGNVSDLVKSNMLLYLGAEGFNQKNKYTLSYTTFYALQHLFYELFMIFPKKNLVLKYVVMREILQIGSIVQPQAGRWC